MNNLTKKILITGGTGFVGGNLIKQLNANNICINLGRKKMDLCDNIYWDLRGDIDQVCIKNDIDTIIHCASIIGDSRLPIGNFVDINVKSTLELLNLSIKKKIKHFIYISSGAVYGFKQDTCRETDLCNPQNTYGFTKQCSEIICKIYEKEIKISILRLFFPYGYYQKERLISNLIDKILGNQVIELNDEGKPYINPINIVDVCNIIELIVNQEIAGIYNIAGGEIISIKQLCDFIMKKLNIYGITYIYSHKKTSNLIGSIERIEKDLRYKCQIDINMGLERQIERFLYENAKNTNL